MNTFTARTPVDLLAIVPYAIGFHPEDSVVLLTAGGAGALGGRPSFHARVDFPLVEEEQRALTGMLRGVIRQHGSDLVGLVIYSEDAAATKAFASLVEAALGQDGVEVLDVIRSDGERFYVPEDLDDPGVPYDLSVHPFNAAGVLEGRVVYESRAALRDSLVGTDSDDREAVNVAADAFLEKLTAIGARGEPLGQELARQATWLRGRLNRALGSLEPISVDDAARMLVLVSFEAVREVAWAPMARAAAGRQVHLWRGLVQRAPTDLQAGACGLLAFAAWLLGEGALAWCALDRCLETNPDDPLGHYVTTLLNSAVPPLVWVPQPLESLRIFVAFDGDLTRRSGT